MDRQWMDEHIQSTAVLAVTTWKPVEWLRIDSEITGPIAVYEDARYIGLAKRDDVAKLIFG